MKMVIVGGVAGGATAAARLRRLDESADIVMFERSGYISYANCGLPYYVGGVIEEEEALTLQTPESFFDRFRVRVKVRHEVTAIHLERKAVTVKNLQTGEVFEERYDKLLLSPGAKPVRPDQPGVDSQYLFTLRTVEDTLKIKNYIEANRPRSVVVAGGGFIGVELAENLRRMGMQVTIADMAGQLMTPFDRDMASLLHAEARSHGVMLRLGQAVAAFEETAGRKGLMVRLSGGDAIRADMAVLAIGVAPDSALAMAAGLKTGLRGSIVVNDRMQTSDPDIYAVGDAVQLRHAVTGEDTLLSLAGPANRQARIAADNMLGGDSHYLGAQGSSIIKVFDLTAAATGINEQTARRLGLDVDWVVLSPMSHAGYYPGGQVMTMKVMFDKKNGRLLGAQIVGGEGVDKRIDVLACAVHAGMKAADLKDVELAYAPPYASAKDPVNLAGYVADNVQSGLIRQWQVGDWEKLPKDGSVTLLDTRTEEEYAAGHAPLFINIPVDGLRERLHEIPAGKPVYVMCQSGLRSYVAARILAGNGYDVYNLAGGYRFFDAVVNERAAAKAAAACGMEKEEIT